jgi:hypothetical protein
VFLRFLKKLEMQAGTVAYTYNPSYFGGEFQKDLSLKASQGKKVRPIS